MGKCPYLRRLELQLAEEQDLGRAIAGQKRFNPAGERDKTG